MMLDDDTETSVRRCNNPDVLDSAWIQRTTVHEISFSVEIFSTLTNCALRISFPDTYTSHLSIPEKCRQSISLLPSAR